jgi:hypothetical protein
VGKLSHIHESELQVSGPIGNDAPVQIIGGRVATLPFNSTLNELVMILGRLHEVIRILGAKPLSENESASVFNMNREAPVLIKSAFIWLRSLLDLFAFHARFLLFDKADQANDSFFELREAISNRSMMHWKPLVSDSETLRLAFEGSSAWADVLRDPSKGNRGVRDSIVHASCRVLFGVAFAESASGTATAHLTADPEHRELISCLRRSLEGFCGLCTGVCQAVERRRAYSRHDLVVFDFGTDEDLCGFWPKI